MLTIRPVQDPEEQKDICRRCGMEYIPRAFCHAAEENGLLGAAQSRIEADRGVIVSMRAAAGAGRDEEAMFLLCRAVLNFFDLCGLKEAEFSPLAEAERKTALCAGFEPCGRILAARDLPELFKHRCGAHKQPENTENHDCSKQFKTK